MDEEKEKTAEAEDAQAATESAQATDGAIENADGKKKASEHTAYQPLSEKTTRIIRWSLGAVLLVIFAVIMLVKRYC